MNQILTRIFPIAIIVLNIAAAMMCFWQRDIKKGFYWLMAAGLNITVII